jgi:hypothetical protein
VRWWDEGATTYRSAAMLSTAERAALPDLPIPEHARLGVGDKPVFFGHYWLTGLPSLQSDRAVCVDYSAGKGGPLVAYTEIDTLIDRAARARLCRAVQDAMQYPSPENVATRQGWLSD